jgi:hypothetical protein
MTKSTRHIANLPGRLRQDAGADQSSDINAGTREGDEAHTEESGNAYVNPAEAQRHLVKISNTKHEPIRPTFKDISSLPAVLDLVTAAKILGIGRTKAYELAQVDSFPCRVLRIGANYRVPTAELLRVIGLASNM